MEYHCYICGSDMVRHDDNVVYDDHEDMEIIESDFSCKGCKATALFYHKKQVGYPRQLALFPCLGLEDKS